MFRPAKTLQIPLLAASLTLPLSQGCTSFTAYSARNHSTTPADVYFPARPPGEHSVSLRCERAAQPEWANCCGQVAVTTVLNAIGDRIEAEVVCREMNPAGIFTTPNGIVSYLQNRGVASLGVNKASLEEIAECIDSGRPVIALVRGSSSPHWVTIPGYTRHVEFEGSSVKKGAVLSIDVMDHCIADGCEDGRKELKAEEFMQIWNDPYGGSRVSGLLSHSRFMVELMPPAGRENRHPAMVSNLVADSTFEMMTAVHRLNPSWAKGLRNLFDK